jgi:hypothetical protein
VFSLVLRLFWGDEWALAAAVYIAPLDPDLVRRIVTTRFLSTKTSIFISDFELCE